MKLSIDTDAARQAHVDNVSSKATGIIMELEDRLDDLSTSDQLELLDRVKAVIGSKTDVAAFVAGTYSQATDSTGAPARALGGGSDDTTGSTSGGVDEANAALQVIMASNGVPPGVKAAILRIITPADPNHIRVKDDGTPVALEAAEAKLNDERDPAKSGSLAKKLADAQEELRKEKDPAQAGSLAKQLADAQAAGPAADSTPKTPLRAEVTKLSEVIANAGDPMFGNGKSISSTDFAKLQSAVTAIDTATR